MCCFILCSFVSWLVGSNRHVMEKPLTGGDLTGLPLASGLFRSFHGTAGLFDYISAPKSRFFKAGAEKTYENMSDTSHIRSPIAGSLLKSCRLPCGCIFNFEFFKNGLDNSSDYAIISELFEKQACCCSSVGRARHW